MSYYWANLKILLPLGVEKHNGETMRTVKVCDALCGAGKTTACINLINSSDQRFIFITPYLAEVERIVKCCADKKFVTPSSRVYDGYTKLDDIHELLKQGRNIASTHALFANYTDETKELIRSQRYILILDEVIDLFKPVGIDKGDIEMLLRNNVAFKSGDGIVWGDEEYTGVTFNEIMQMSKSKNLIDLGGSLFFWIVPMDVFGCFAEIYILTYLFEHQPLKSFFDIYGFKYELIGTKRIGNSYQLCSITEMDRAIDLRNKIHILDNEKLNEIGKDYYALSSRWFDKSLKESGQPNIERLKHNLANLFRHIFAGETNQRMWASVTQYRKCIRGKGYSNGFISFNRRATNEFSHKKYLAYCVNVFLQPWMTNYLKKLGAAEMNQDMYALSVLVQWIFRSAIRNGEEVWIYLPSRRMRKILEQWLENLVRGDDLKPITAPRNEFMRFKSRKAIREFLRQGDEQGEKK